MCRSELPIPSSVLTRYALLARCTRLRHAQEPGFPPTFQERKRERERGESGQLATLFCSYSNNHRINSSHKHWHHPNRASSYQSFRSTTPSPSSPFVSVNSTESHPKKLHLRARGAIKNLTQNAASKSPSRPRSPLLQPSPAGASLQTSTHGN